MEMVGTNTDRWCDVEQKFSESFHWNVEAKNPDTNMPYKPFEKFTKLSMIMNGFGDEAVCCFFHVKV